MNRNPKNQFTNGHKGHTKTHGLSSSPEYWAWASMKARCLNVKSPQFADYGGRGISVSPEWVASFESFIAHIGRRPSPQHSIDRIENDGNYEPGNVRWATSATQNRNRRNNHWVTFNGKTLTLEDWARDCSTTGKNEGRRGFAILGQNETGTKGTGWKIFCGSPKREW